jgi:hypothetical protein
MAIVRLLDYAMHLQKISQLFSRKREPDFSAAFTMHLRERFGVLPPRKRLSRLHCSWHLEAPPARIVDFTVFRLEGDHLAEVSRLVESLFISIHSEVQNHLFYHTASEVFCSVVLQDGHTAVAVFRRLQNSNDSV